MNLNHILSSLSAVCFYLAFTPMAAAQGPPPRVEICHVSPTGVATTLLVPEQPAQNHLSNHVGDTLGPGGDTLFRPGVTLWTDHPLVVEVSKVVDGPGWDDLTRLQLHTLPGEWPGGDVGRVSMRDEQRASHRGPCHGSILSLDE